mgnify:CR=1 FL=1
MAGNPCVAMQDCQEQGKALGIEIAMVATHHLFRLFLILMTSPLVFKLWRSRDEAKAASD